MNPVRHESIVVQYCLDPLHSFLNKINTPLRLENSNLHWLVVSAIPVAGLANYILTLNEHIDHDDLSLNESFITRLNSSEFQEEEDDDPSLLKEDTPSSFPQPSYTATDLRETIHRRIPSVVSEPLRLNLPQEKLQSILWGNVATIIAALAISLFGGFGLTLVHGLAHATILCSVIIITDILRLVHKRGDDVFSFLTDVGNVFSSQRRNSGRDLALGDSHAEPDLVHQRQSGSQFRSHRSMSGSNTAFNHTGSA